MAELERVDILIQSHLLYIKNTFVSSDLYRGLYITEQDVQANMDKPLGEPWWCVDTMSSVALSESMLHLQDSIETRRLASRHMGIHLRLDELSKLFGLSKQEIDIVLLALAPEIDTRYELMYAYLQDNVTKKYPGVDLLLNLLGQSPRDRLGLRRCFADDSPLLVYQLIELVAEPEKSHGGLLSRIVKLPQRLVDYLLDTQMIDKSLAAFCRVVESSSLYDVDELHPSVQATIEKLTGQLQHSPINSVIHLQGPEGSGRLQASLRIVHGRPGPILEVDLEPIVSGMLAATVTPTAADWDRLFRTIVREALLYNADLYFCHFDVLLTEPNKACQTALFRALTYYQGLCFLSGQAPWLARSLLTDKDFYSLELIDLAPAQRANIWRRLLAGEVAVFPDQDLLHLADRFRFNPTQIRDAIATAKQLAASSASDTAVFDLKTLYRACRLNTNHKLSELAQHIVPRYDWDDITLEDDKLAQLHQLYSTIEHRYRVYDDWGFGDKLSLGKGVSALFSGPSGTGKTMAAEIIARRLGLDIYKIDLSSIVSKYIGETEKNLSRIFHEAETSNAMLFFDEADALFGKRTEIKSSHDRYANIEVAYLLQKLEEYDGITILATNLRKNMDEAFIRRLAFIIGFSLPGNDERTRIWQSIWPDTTPLSPDLDLTFMATQFKLSGGNIKNIALAASFMAADDGDCVEMKHLLMATQREFEKQGRASVRTDFGQYGDLLT